MSFKEVSCLFRWCIMFCLLISWWTLLQWSMILWYVSLWVSLKFIAWLVKVLYWFFCFTFSVPKIEDCKNLGVDIGVKQVSLRISSPSLNCCRILMMIIILLIPDFLYVSRWISHEKYCLQVLGYISQSELFLRCWTEAAKIKENAELPSDQDMHMQVCM